MALVIVEIHVIEIGNGAIIRLESELGEEKEELQRTPLAWAEEEH